VADKKIPALTAAATPLAGSELLPISQSSTTVNVSVANLTVGRDISVGNVTTTKNIIFGASYAGGSFSTDYLDGRYLTSRIFNVPSGSSYVFAYAGGDGVTFSSAGDITPNIGNFKPIAGKGIDFSANGGDILTQYDEGTWTTTVTNTSNFTGTPTLSNGKYTRIGRLIMIEGKFSGTVTIGSLNTYFQFTLPISRASSADSGAGTIMTGNNLKLGAIENAGADTTTAYVVIPSTSLQPAGADTFLFTYIYTA
jgi:hypothetical protein